MKTDIIGVHSQRANNQAANGRDRDAETGRLYSKVVERYALFFDRPEVRLRFLNNTLAKQAQREQQLRESLKRLRFLERTRFYDWILEARLYSAILEELRSMAHVVPSARRHHLNNIRVPFSARAFYFLYQARHAFYAVGVLITGFILFGLYTAATWSARHANTWLAQRYQKGRAPIVVTTAGQGTTTAFAATGARFLPDYKPEKVWLVERDAETERYSNGARILTRYETENHPRGYYLIPRGSESLGEALRRDPVGIVYHTSESDILPFTPDNNMSIKQRSQGLIEYVHRNKSYNYLIDRYGEIYRIVKDDHAAHHAGNSIWADSRYVYVGLNESFIGISFESTSTAGTIEETLTEAQFTAGRALTTVLRSKYNIDDANCTTHGLVSINPEKMLIAFHHDWVRNFPFELMGLSDKYKVAPPNMADYGFTYDEEILEKLGRVLWPGAIAAEEGFRKRAETSRSNPELLRRKLRDRYRAQLEKARKLRAPDEPDAPLSAQIAGNNNSAPSGEK
ncbi:MAG: N-acetylmuramoyl-L-alanine amidase [Acidobacteriota bacterium]|nr:MAG: N-acetylmuramoyl-L-alanine amidase [Acidobacteriota bacterium]